MKVGLIGYGTIGQILAKAVEEGRAGDVTLTIVKDMNKDPPFEVADGSPLYTDSIERFLDADLDLVVEAASQLVLREYGALVLRSGRDLATVSVGALADPAFLQELLQLSSRHGGRLLIPSGAIGGLDALSAACIDEVDEVTLTSTKPVKAFRGVRSLIDPDLDLETITAATCIYEGPAEEVATKYPKNVNVAAALSLAGIGFAKTKVRVVADPHAQRNVHRIEARGAFGELSIELKLHPSPTNPKTTYLAALSLVSLVKRLTGRMRVGG
jgi:aspartate dehydrogenase